MQIPGLQLVTSNSGQGHSSFVLQFDLSKSVDAAATDVQAAITRATAQLPVDLPSPPTFTKTNPNDQPIMYVGITSDSATQGQLFDYANTQVGERISILPGVSQVAVYGAQSAVRIKADPSAMAARNLTIDDLAAALKNGTSYTGAGQFDGEHHTFLLQPEGQLSEASQYENLIVRQGNGAPVYLKDVATVKNGLQDERISMRFWYRGHEVPAATVVVAVFRRAGSNAVEVAKSIRDLLPTVQAQLPSSVGIVPIYDRSQGIVNSVKDVQATLFVAFALVVLVIYFFLGRARDTLIPVVALPLSLLLTFVVMNILGYSLDNLSLMALTLAIGFLVDDAIVFLENTVRLMESGLGFPSRCIPSACFYGRPGWAHFSRVLDHHHRFDFCQWHRFADTYTAHVLRLAPGTRRAREKKLDRARHRRHRKKSAIGLRAFLVVFSSVSLDFPGDLGGLPTGNCLLLLHCSKGLSPHRR